jgi:hypothetical protein
VALTGPMVGLGLRSPSLIGLGLVLRLRISKSNSDRTLVWTWTSKSNSESDFGLWARKLDFGKVRGRWIGFLFWTWTSCASLGLVRPGAGTVQFRRSANFLPPHSTWRAMCYWAVVTIGHYLKRYVTHRLHVGFGPPKGVAAFAQQLVQQHQHHLRRLSQLDVALAVPTHTTASSEQSVASCTYTDGRQ